MKKALLLVIGLESALLLGGLGAFLLGGLDRFQREPPPLPIFRPPLYDTRIGDLVRYERRERATGRVLGYLEYKVELVVIPEGTTIGAEILLSIKETDAQGRSRSRETRIRPRTLTQGFLPPAFEDDGADYPSGERPVVSRISTATFPLRDPPPPPRTPPPPVRGFLVEAVIPRRSLTEVAERFWMTDRVPVFGVARWERGDEVLVLHRMELERRG